MAHHKYKKPRQQRAGDRVGRTSGAPGSPHWSHRLGNSRGSYKAKYEEKYPLVARTILRGLKLSHF